MTMTDFVDATFYVQVEPEFNYMGTQVLGARAVRLTQKKPDLPKGGTVLTKLTVRIPKSSFMPLRPEAIVVIPEGMAVAHPIEVEAQDPADV